MQEYCYTLFAIGSAQSRDAFFNLSQHLSETFPENMQFVTNMGSYYLLKEDYKTALKYFEESTTYPENLQAGRPGDAGIEPKSRYFMAQCKKALGDEAGYKAELENSLKGWIHAGEMDYWRVKALRELGRDSETAPLIAELKQAIKELETPPPTVINAYAKFAGDNSAMERAAKARFKAGELRKLLNEIDK